MDTVKPREIVEPAKGKEETPEDWKSFGLFLVKLVLIVLIFRTFVFTSFNIPSESMLPRLHNGDYLFAAKWPYGYSSAALPFGIDLGDGRLFGSAPERGDVVIFKHPIDRSDYIKRVIGLPGDEVQVIGGVLHLNGTAVKREKIADFVQQVDQGMIDSARKSGRMSPCAISSLLGTASDGKAVCRYPRYRETLPSGASYDVLDFQYTQEADDTPPFTVPEDHIFLMGDNRDNSLDSRFPASAGQGVGIVSQEDLVGRASFMYFSTDGSAEWIKPWTWFTAARWSRIGKSI